MCLIPGIERVNAAWRQKVLPGFHGSTILLACETDGKYKLVISPSFSSKEILSV